MGTPSRSRSPVPGAHNLVEKQPCKQPGLVTRAKPEPLRDAVGAQRTKRLLPLGRCGEVPGRGGICVQPSRKKERSPRREKRRGGGHQSLGKQLGQTKRERRRITISASAF